MYSRSYGSIETERKIDGISIPADYNGSLYRKQPTQTSPISKAPAEKEEAPEKPLPPITEEKKQSAGTLTSLLERFTAEDIILFVLVFSLLREDNEDPGAILAVILALLLL